MAGDWENDNNTCYYSKQEAAGNDSAGDDCRDSHIDVCWEGSVIGEGTEKSPNYQHLSSLVLADRVLPAFIRENNKGPS